MSEDLDEELLSAYLDDEVTADQRARVERCLRDSPVWRQLFDELRALRASILALPRYKLDESLDRQVLADAEKRLLGSVRQSPAPTNANPSSPAQATSISPGAGRPAGEPRVKTAEGPATLDGPAALDGPLALDGPAALDGPKLRLPRGWRAWAWPAVALAAALLIKLLDTTPEPRKVAQAPPAKAAPTREPPMRLPRETSIGAAPSKEQKRSIGRHDAAAESKDVGGTLDEMARGAATVPDSTAAPATAAPATLAPAAAAPTSADRDAADKLADSPERADKVADAKAIPHAASGEEPASQGAMPASRPRGMAGESSSAGAAPRRSMAKSKAGAAPSANGGKAAETGEPGASGKAGASGEPALADGDELVVELELQPKAAAMRAFNDMLTRNSIVPQATAPGNLANYGHAANDPSQTIDSRRSRNALGGQQAAGAANAVPVTEVRVEASPRQIAAMLAEMQQRPDDFAAVVSQPAARSNWQQGLAQYNRKADSPQALESTAPSMRSFRGAAKQRADGSREAGANPSPAANQSAPLATPALEPADAVREQAKTRQRPAAQLNGQAAGDERKVRVVFLLWTAVPNEKADPNEKGEPNNKAEANEKGEAQPTSPAPRAPAEEPAPATDSPPAPTK